ncbi:Glycerophosphoryl diester phosphodiesterase [Gracilaria domingensis]|nr:Glycerophosphoryl diester phosphodiesterase [Gracilaria domingensis]
MRRSAQNDPSSTMPLFSVDDEEEESFAHHAPPPPPPSRKSFFRNTAGSSRSPSLFLMRLNRLLFFFFPRILATIVIVLMAVTLLPGGWRVALCTANLLPAPSLRPGENITLIAHRGCEFPYPENSIHALRFGAEQLGYVEVDITLTSDGKVISMHDQTLDRTTNGTGIVCTKSLDYIKELELNMPTRDPRGRLAQGKFCSVLSRRGNTVPCTYRVPTLEEIFDELPDHTRFMLDIKDCYANGSPSSSPKCTNCTVLMKATKDIMERFAIVPERVVFTSPQPASLKVFQDGIPKSTFAISLDQGYSHYKRSTFAELISKGQYDYAAMYYGLIAVRPDFVRIMRAEKVKGVGRPGDVYAWTIRKDLDYRLARCAGVSKMIVAEPHRLKKSFTSGNIAEWLAENV